MKMIETISLRKCCRLIHSILLYTTLNFVFDTNDYHDDDEPDGYMTDVVHAATSEVDKCFHKPMQFLNNEMMRMCFDAEVVQGDIVK